MQESQTFGSESDSCRLANIALTPLWSPVDVLTLHAIEPPRPTWTSTICKKSKKVLQKISTPCPTGTTVVQWHSQKLGTQNSILKIY